MLSRINPETTQAWQELKNYFAEMSSVPMRELFKAEPGRFSKYTVTDNDIVFFADDDMVFLFVPKYFR